MGFLDLVKAFTEHAAKDASRSCERIERKYGSRMSQEQLDRVRSRKAGLDAIADKCKRRK